jgi:ATP-binding cassette, subfamily B, bacterial
VIPGTTAAGTAPTPASGPVESATYEPVAVERRYPPPGATIDPDGGKGWLRRMAPLVRAHRRLLIISLAASAIALVAQVAVPAVISTAIDDALIDRSAPLSRFVWILVGLAAVRGLFAYVSRYGLYRMAYQIETDLRSVIYRHLTRLSFSFFDRVQSGQIISRANSDIRSVQMFLGFAPLMSMSVLSFFLALGFMLTISIPLTLASVITLPGVYVIGVLLRNRVFPLSWIVQQRTAELATVVDENVNGVRVVRSFAAERRQIDQLARAARRLQWSNLATVDARARFAPIMENLPRIGLVVVLLYGGHLVIDGQIQLGALVAFNAYILMMQTPFRVLGFFLMLQHRARASAERIFELLDETPDVTERPGAVDLVDPVGQIELSHVRFGYGDDADILRDVDLSVEPGETVAVVGRTGSGKSTLARLLPRFYDARGGAVTIDGHDVRDLTLASLRAHVGVVLDEAFLFSTSVRDNIAYGRPDASLDEVRSAAIAAQADGFIEELPEGYDAVLGERGYTLSGGQRQRIALARALLVNPRILVLDDATSAIDVQVEAAIHRALAERLHDRTTIVIAHRLSTIALADRVVLLEDGRVLASGPHAELMATEPRYAAVLAHLDDDREVS